MKRSPKALTDLDRAVLELLQRKVRSKDGREMSIIEGLLGQDAAAALQGDDQAIKRLRAEYARACDRNADRVEAGNGITDPVDVVEKRLQPLFRM